MVSCCWKGGLAALVAGLLLSDTALAEPGATAAVRQPVQLVAPPLRAPNNHYAQNALYQDDAAWSPFAEEAPSAPLPSQHELVPDEAYDPPSSEFSFRPVAEPSTSESSKSEPEQDEPSTDKPAVEPDPAPVYFCPKARGPQPWRIPQPCVLQNAGIALGGWLQQGITLNAQVPQDRFNGPVATNDRHAEWQMNQMWMFLNRPINNDGCGWDLGGRIDMIYGSDSRFGVNWGLENRINGLDQPYGLVIPQMYAEVAYNDLSVKLGHFAGLLSYEQVPAVANFFYSHSYAMGMTEPLLVTGALANYNLTDQWSIQAGFHRGWMMWEDLNNDCDFMGGVKWVSMDKATSISYSVSIGPQDPVVGDQNRFASSLLIQRRLNKKLRYVLQHNLGFENNGDPRSNEDAEWYGLCQYLFYAMNKKWEAGLRLEWLRDDDGLFYGAGNVPGNSRAWNGGPGFAGNWFEVSWGLNYRPCPNVVVRPELRYDWYDGIRDVKGNLPFDDGNKTYQLTIATDLIITY